MDVRAAGLGDQLSRRTVRPVAARVGARYSGAGARRAGRSGAERRDTSPSARRDHIARLDLEYAGREAPQRLRGAAPAAERRLDELAGGERCAITIAVSTQRRRDAEVSTPRRRGGATKRKCVSSRAA